ncbi:glycosyltransferase family 4 protein [Sphingobacterium tabacisoli]|uniref:Glycosyltransferase family 4 protein n=1 Tax=Sphingobacterium tabacisoli TaxID=2044855 RepID=A0ABW5L7B5_9SPHI|nr:glycosyltransferase family 4 protein [Sphingobacterium tabacisoli]
MKIIYNIAGLYNAGGMERVLTNKANYLAGAGHQVIIVTTDQKSRNPYFDLNEAVEQIDLNINYDSIQRLGLVSKVIAYRRKQRLHKSKLESVLKELKGDIVISMFDHDVSFLYKIKDGSKKLLEIHFSRYKRVQYGRKGVWGIIDQLRSKKDVYLAQKYDRFIVLTEEDKHYWGSLKNIEVIPNANSFSPKEVSNLDKKVAVAIGRLDYQKGFDDLIKIWAMVQPIFPDWRLHIYGEGRLESDLQMLIERLNMKSAIQLNKPTKNIEEVYLGSSVYLMTSRYEGLPMALLEAQACGLPLLSYACKCGPRDIIEQGRNGYWVEQGDQIKFGERLRELLNSDSLRREMGEAAKVMSMRFSEKVVMEHWGNVFSEVLKERK